MPRTQAGLAAALGVELDTLQGWECGRRLANVRAGAWLGLRRRLPALGADATLVQWLDADRIIAAGLGDDIGGPHPLAGWVHTRDTAHLLAWALTGTAPSALAGRLPRPRRGPGAAASQLAAADRAAFLGHLRSATEDAARQGEARALLHRQALYLASYDQGPDAAAWTASALHRRRDVFGPHSGRRPARPPRRSPGSVTRSRCWTSSTALWPTTTRPRPANLNYWALWLGVLPVPQPDDAFMQDRDLSGWDPVTLLRGLALGLHLAPGYVDLYGHSLWALLAAFPWLPHASGQLAGLLCERTSRLLDEVPLSARSRRELARVHYVFDHNR
ncbi:XRE family transcriptional regulator [Streptomyces sp. NPDC021212]|uniref:XRE family transcriptional regulator n=1 Tax=Streptomyces sp. NPDC021212 TaxID=3365118 RepID=UPI00379E3B5F